MDQNSREILDRWKTSLNIKTDKELREKLGVEREEIMTIGDGNNDVEMLEFAGIGVAMGNGTESAKKAANYVTDTNENHGVAKAIEKYILSKN